MYADRFSHQPRLKPVSLGAAVAVNGGLVALLLLSSPQFRDAVTPRPFVIESIPVPPDPLPPEPKPEPRTERTITPPVSRPFVPDPVVPSHPDRPAIDTTTVLPALPPASSSGLGTEVPAEPAARAAPVLVEAAPDPRYARDFQPDYPPSERRAGREGVVTVRVLIGTDGRVKAVEQVRSASEAFFAATRRQALSHWRFKPATRDGVPVESWRTMTVRFVLED